MTTQSNTLRSSKLQASLALLGAVMIWGSSAAVLRGMALDLSPGNSIAIRYVLLALIAAPTLAFTGGWRIAKADWPRLLVTGIFGMAGYNYAVNEGFARVEAGLGTVVTMVEPIFIAILAVIFLKEKLPRSIWPGTAICLIGAAALFWPSIAQTTTTPVSWTGIGFLMICCTGWAIYTIAAKPLLETYSSLTITLWTMLIAAPFMWPLADQSLVTLFKNLDANHWLQVLYLVLPNALVGTFLWNYGARDISGSVTGAFLYLIPVFGVLSGWIMLGEAITPRFVIGAAMMMAGVAVVQFGTLLFKAKAS
jgi:drug/metabolite transporter (DMT)-like permease